MFHMELLQQSIVNAKLFLTFTIIKFQEAEMNYKMGEFEVAVVGAGDRKSVV